MLRKKLLYLCTGILIAVGLSACGSKGKAVESTAEISTEALTEEDSDDSSESLANGELTVLYTNDVHGYIYNKVKNDNGDEELGLSYSNLKALKDELKSEGKNVLLVDVGDHAQGAVYAAMSEGDDIIDLMNDVGYDLATLGNHEFDYGQFKAFKFIDNATFPYVSCNLYNVSDKLLVLPGYKVFEVGGIRVAFIGITTPQTMTSSSPKNFQNEKGEFIYGIASGEDGSELYTFVQNAIDDARNEADVVIAVGHLGVETSAAPYRSIDVIANTSGLDAFLDGHSHTRMDEELVEDKDGNKVVLSQTGCYFSAIGDMEIKVKDGKPSISTSLIEEYDNEDKDIRAKIDDIAKGIEEELGETIANESVPLYTNEPGTDNRLIRKQETNLGDLVADSIYYYYNNVMDLDCDITVANGGGIRQDMPDGIHTYLDCKSIEPFGNVSCLIKASGQIIKDALELGAMYAPEEKGSFLHVAGLKYSIDTSIKSSITLDETERFVSGPTGEYRVHDIEVYNKETGEYEPLDVNKTYNIAGINYILRNDGNGMTMFDDCEIVVDYISEDYIILAEYIKAFSDGKVATANSPLSSLKGYMIDYENPNGAGRITIK